MQTILKKGDRVIYIKKSSTALATIIDVHHDAELPYYTILLRKNKQKQTIRKYLKKISIDDILARLI